MEIEPLALNWEERPLKRERVAQLMGMRAANPASAALFLPAADWLCVRAAASVGAILPGFTKVVAVESDPDTFCAMKDNQDSLGAGWDIDAYPVALESLPASALPDEISFAFVDLLGHLGGGILRFMEDVLAPRLVPGALVAVTTTCDGNLRSNDFALAAHAAFSSHGGRGLAAAASMSRPVGWSGEPCAGISLSLALLLSGLRGLEGNLGHLRPYRDRAPGDRAGGRRLMCVTTFEVTGRRRDRTWWPGADDIQPLVPVFARSRAGYLGGSRPGDSRGSRALPGHSDILRLRRAEISRAAPLLGEVSAVRARMVGLVAEMEHLAAEEERLRSLLGRRFPRPLGIAA